MYKINNVSKKLTFIKIIVLKLQLSIQNPNPAPEDTLGTTADLECQYCDFSHRPPLQS